MVQQLPTNPEEFFFGGGADGRKGLILLQTHLSHTFPGMTALPGGGLGGLGGCSCWVRVQQCHTGLPVALQQSVPPLPALLCSLGKSSLPAPSPLNRQSCCPCVCVSVYLSRRLSLQQFLSTNEQMKHQLDENRGAMHSINTAFSLSATPIRLVQKRLACFRRSSPCSPTFFGQRLLLFHYKFGVWGWGLNYF